MLRGEASVASAKNRAEHSYGVQSLAETLALSVPA
jgi:hypothetical protein